MRRLRSMRSAIGSLCLGVLVSCAVGPPDSLVIGGGVSMLRPHGSCYLEGSESLGFADLGGVAIQRDLGVGSEVAPFASGVSRWQRFALGIGLSSYDGEGSALLGSGFGAIPAGSRVHTTMDWDAGNLLLSYDCIESPWVELAIGCELLYVDSEVRVRPVGGLLTGSELLSARLLAPMSHLAARITDGVWSLGGQFAFSGGDFGDASGWVFDSQLAIGLRPADQLELSGGWRATGLDVKGDASGAEFSLEMVFSGWFLEAGVRW